MRAFAIQLDIAWEDREANHRKVAGLIEAARPEAQSLLVLPEMFATGFSMNLAAIDEGAVQPTERFLAALARKHASFIVAGIATRAASGRGRNQAIVLDPAGNAIARYSKLHPFCIGGEKDYFDAGDGVVTFDWNGLAAAPFICYDLRFPEIFRHSTRRGANLFCVIASWPDVRMDHWKTLLHARAIENQAYVIGVNRVGRDPSHGYAGGSLIVDPMGAVLADAGETECVVAAEISLKSVNTTRQSLPFLNDIRNDFVK